MGNYLNLKEINQEQSLDICKFNIKTGGNVFLFGRRGVGKTHIALKAAEDQNITCTYINLSVMDKADMLGYPDMQAKNEYVTYKYPYYMPLLKDGQKPNNILLFDEVDKAAPEITAPLLEILQFRTINGKPLNITSCILTGNLSNEGAYSNNISTALLDRGSKYILKFSFDNWLDWAKKNKVHDLILGFLSSNIEFTCGKEEDVTYASPSPRGWTLASEALIKARSMSIVDIDTITSIISGYVGDEAGVKFKIWYENYRKYEPFVASLIEVGEMTFNFESLLPTEKLVFVITACYFTKIKVSQGRLKQSEKFKYLQNLCKFIVAYNIDMETQILALSNSFNFQMITEYKLYECGIFFDLFKKISEKINRGK